MNREQMIAWLTLEGWVPNLEDQEWWAGCQLGRTNVYRDNDQEIVHEITIDDGSPPPANWEDMSDWIVIDLFNYIQEHNL